MGVRTLIDIAKRLRKDSTEPFPSPTRGEGRKILTIRNMMKEGIPCINVPKKENSGATHLKGNLSRGKIIPVVRKAFSSPIAYLKGSSL